MRSLWLMLVLLELLSSAVTAESLLFCGRKTVHRVQWSPPTDGTEPVVQFTWSWSAEGCPQLPAAMQSAFATTDECKPVGDGSRILISSSSQGCAVVEYPSGRALWYARVPNAHSIELLPRDRIIVASSVHAQGNRLVLFNMATSDQPLLSVPLPSGHGVVWDPQRERLWALGLDGLRSYSLTDWDSDQPSLTLDHTYTLPDSDGHDLQAVPDGVDLIVTTGQRVFLFDRKSTEFRPHPALGLQGRVKSISQHPKTGRLVYVQAEEQWWSHTLRLLSPDQSIRLSEQDLYKARWYPETVPAPGDHSK